MSQHRAALRSLVIAGLLFTLALLILAASRLAHGQEPAHPLPANVYENTATGETINMTGWRQEHGFLFLEKNGHDCARVHMGDARIAGSTVYYVSTYRHFGAAHDVSVMPFANPGAALHFAINECK